MNDKLRLVNRNWLIWIVANLGRVFTRRGCLEKGSPNRRVLQVSTLGKHEISLHATKGWRVVRVGK